MIQPSKTITATPLSDQYKAVFAGEKPVCAICETVINVAYDDSVGLFLCEWCSEKEVMNDDH